MAAKMNKNTIFKYLNEANPNNLLKANRIKRLGYKEWPSKMVSFVYERTKLAAPRSLVVAGRKQYVVHSSLFLI